MAAEYYNIDQTSGLGRLGIGALFALSLHALILVWFAMPSSQNIISSDLYSPPTNISIRFMPPVQEKVVIEKPVQPLQKSQAVQKPIIKKNVAKKIVKIQPPILNKIEPAARSAEPLKAINPRPIKPAPHTEQRPINDAPESIPVVTQVNLKGKRVRPKYPKRSLTLRQEGTVFLRVLISQNGQLEELKVHRPSQYALLNQAAVKAVKKWQFEPTQRNGRAIKSWVEIPIEFAIQ